MRKLPIIPSSKIIIVFLVSILYFIYNLYIIMTIIYEGIQDSVSFKMHIQKLIDFPYKWKKEIRKSIKSKYGWRVIYIGMKRFLLSRYKNHGGKVNTRFYYMKIFTYSKCKNKAISINITVKLRLQMITKSAWASSIFCFHFKESRKL